MKLLREATDVVHDLTYKATGFLSRVAEGEGLWPRRSDGVAWRVVA